MVWDGDATPGKGAFAERQAAYRLAWVEALERFSVSGVKSLIALFLVDHVLATGDRGVIALEGLKRALEHLYGPLSSVALASQIYGFQNALLYLSVPLGGVFGDWLVGRRRAVRIGAILMMAGPLLLMTRAFLLPGLMLFAMGAGCVKGNLAAQVGEIFRDERERRRGFALYLAFLNAGVFLGPLACGAVANWLGWNLGFGVAAAGIGFGLLLYGGNPTPASAMPSAREDSAEREEDARAHTDWFRLIAAIGAVYLAFAAYEQSFNLVLIWAERHVALQLGGLTMPASWIVSADGLMSILLIWVAEAAFRWWEERGTVIGPAMRIQIGCAACMLGFLLLAAGAMLGHGERLPLIWLLGFLLLVDLAIVLVWPAGLALITSEARRRQVGLLVGIFYLHGFFAGLWVAAAGTLYERLGPARFFLLHAAIAAAGVVVMRAGVSLSSLFRRTAALPPAFSS